jgi:signal peptidase I
MNRARQHSKRGTGELWVRPQMADTGFLLEWAYWRDNLHSLAEIVRPTVTGISLIFVLLFGYGYTIHDMRFFAVSSDSMAPTLKHGDFILTIASASYGRGDIIVFTDPVTPRAHLSKRIVGVPGDTLTVDFGMLHVNGEPVRESYIAEPMNYSMAPFEVAEGEVFVLGDNRNGSDDSYQWWRAVPLRAVRGRVVQIYLPYQRLQRIGRYVAAPCSP